MSLFLADSRAPRSTMVSSRRSYLTTYGTRSACRPRKGRAISSAPVPPTPATTTRARARARRTLARLLHPRPFGRRAGPGLGAPFKPFGPFGARGTRAGSGGVAVGIGASAGAVGACAGGALTGSDFIDPHSSEIKGHQLHVAVQLQPRIQVGDPDRRHHELRVVERRLGGDQL